MKEFRNCYNSDSCPASWTAHNQACTGCHWKGMGVAELMFGPEELRDRAEALKLSLAKEAAKQGDQHAI